MILFELPLEARLQGTEELYFRKEANRLNFNTFFGALPISKIKKYTTISSLKFHIEISGTAEIQIATEEKVMISRTVTNSEDILVNVADIPPTSKLLYPIVGTDSIYRIIIYTNTEPTQQTNCAIITCTYKREEWVKKNTNYLSRKTDCKIIVVDNGRTLDRSDFSDNVILLPNPNTGGSGGFGKGMKEAVKIGGFTHLLLMDDDVEIDFAALQRTLNFLRFLKPEYADMSISGSMLYMDKPTYQFEAGGHFYENGAQKGFGHFLDLSHADDLIVNEADNDINYGGWWYMCMPVKYAQEGKLPLPFFLKYDDVEYALRCRQKIITLNGVGIWHERFENKYNSFSEYYNTRNYLHLCKLYCKDFTEKKAKKFVSDRIIAKNVRQQYMMAKAVMKGYRDYKKGLKYLQKIDQEKKHEQVRKLNYKFLTYDEIYSLYGFRPDDYTFYPPPDKSSVQQEPQPKEYVFTDAYQDVPEQYVGAKYAVHCDCVRNVGYVTEKNTNLTRLTKNKLLK